MRFVEENAVLIFSKKKKTPQLISEFLLKSYKKVNRSFIPRWSKYFKTK